MSARIVCEAEKSADRFDLVVVDIRDPEHLELEMAAGLYCVTPDDSDAEALAERLYVELCSDSGLDDDERLGSLVMARPSPNPYRGPLVIYRGAAIRRGGNVFRGNAHDLRDALARWAFEDAFFEVRTPIGTDEVRAAVVLVLAHYPAEG